MRWPAARSVFLLVTTTIAARSCSRLLAAPLSKIVLGYRDPAIFRIAVLGLWAFTNLELAYALAARRRAPARLRDRDADQRRAHDRRLGGARGRARARAPRACCSATTAHRRSCCSACGGRCATGLLPRRSTPAARRTGLLFAVRAADRPRRGVRVRAQHRRPLLHLYHERQPEGRRGCTRSRSSSPARSRSSCARSSTPGRRSRTRSRDDAEAARLYGLVTTYYLLVSGWIVAGLALAAAGSCACWPRPPTSTPTRRCRGWRSAGRCTDCGWCSS